METPMAWMGLARGTGVLSLTLAATMAAAQPAAATNESSDVEPDAVAALNRMGASLRALNDMSLKADVTNEQVLTTGQKLQFSGKLDLKAHRPNRLRMDVTSDRQARTLYYDGKTATLFAPRLGYFASFPAPGTIQEMLQAAADRYELDLPLMDLFRWGADQSMTQGLQSAFRVGTETIDGQSCEQYAMRQEGADWQVWIREGANALPCKVVITTTDDPSMPQYSTVFHWRPAQVFPADTFTFTPPANTRRIAIGRVPAASGGGGN